MKQQTVFKMLRMNSPTLSVGILTANLMSLQTELGLLEQARVKIVHFDVMDGCYVPMMTVGPPFIKSIRTDLLKDVHLMVKDPLEKVEEYVQAGADIVTVHVESGNDTLSILKKLGTMCSKNDPSRGLVRGVAINPATPVEILKPLLGDLELISLLAVTPGVKGQEFSYVTETKFKNLKKMLGTLDKEILICIDGGITKNNIDKVAAIGADIIVSGSAIFDGKTPLENARYMMDILKSNAK